MIRAALIMFLLSGCATSGNTGTWERPRTWTPTEKTVLVWSILAVGADILTTNNFLKNPDNFEINPYLTERPSRERVTVTLSATHIILIIIAHYNPAYRIKLLGSKAAINTGFAIHNSTME